jgi:hypothetical protein
VLFYHQCKPMSSCNPHISSSCIEESAAWGAKQVCRPSLGLSPALLWYCHSRTLRHANHPTEGLSLRVHSQQWQHGMASTALGKHRDRVVRGGHSQGGGFRARTWGMLWGSLAIRRVWESPAWWNRPEEGANLVHWRKENWEGLEYWEQREGRRHGVQSLKSVPEV